MRILMNSLLVVLVLCLVRCTYSQSEDCSIFTRCNDCITLSTSCAWCNDIDAFRTYANTSADLNPAPFCATPSELQSLYGCQTTINPSSTISTESGTGSSQVSLSSAQVLLRAGDSTELEITVSPAASVPVDMYLLMDLSLTMQQDLEQIRLFAGDLVTTMQSLTSDFKIAFGSFIDKPVPPFADDLNPDFPCLPDAELLNLTPDTCDAVYSFRHRLNFTGNSSLLQAELDSALLSASPDHPEAVMDALMQVALCEDELTWRPRGESRRLIVVITDGDYHYALDGKLAGISELPKKQCQLDPVSNEYSTSHLQDFPSSAVIAELLNERTMIPIFAVPSAVGTVYSSLVKTIKSAFVETLSANASSIINVVVNQYRVLSSTVVPVVSGFEQIPQDLLNITVLPSDNCSPGSLLANSMDVCEGIESPSEVTYTLTVSVSQDICLANPGPIMARVQFIGFGMVEVNISFECGECDCNPPVDNSPECNGDGTLECSICNCNDRIEGTLCNCPVSSVGAATGCAPNSLVADCSSQGQCVCGVCECDRIEEDSDLVYQGQFCQHNPLNCPRARGDDGLFQPCAGHGTCVDSRCECSSDFTGAACECTRDQSTCLSPGDPTGELCSGKGQCLCGICICDNYSVSIGQYCEECVPCSTSCLRINPCVRCLILGEEEGECSQCEERVKFVNSTSAITGSDSFKTCSLVENFCEVRYQVGTNVMGDEDVISIAIDEDQQSISVLSEGSGRCNQTVPIWPIFVGIILGITFIGLLVIILWRSCAYLAEFLEYRQWEKSMTEETDRSTNNPIFLDPNTKYQNPRYRPGGNSE